MKVDLSTTLTCAAQKTPNGVQKSSLFLNATLPLFVFIIGASFFTGCTSIGLKREPKLRSGFCNPTQDCWPKPEEWQAFGSKLSGKLEMPQSPLMPCRTDATSETCKQVLKDLTNPYFVSDHPAGTQSAGWLGAWTPSVSSYAVVAENTNDIATAVRFAQRYRLKLVIKGTGHDYLGRSNAPDSLLIWTHKMRRVQIQKAFLPVSCSPTHKRVPAVSVEAGVRWLEAYQEVTVRDGRYVQGGGCTTVGAAGGFLQGGGFGSWSKKFGTAAANLLEAEVVTADGKVLVASSCQNQDLFWALRGGGGGTFGIVTRATMRTHPIPQFFGWLNGSLTAKSDEAFRELVERFLIFYHENLSNEHWGEQVKFRGDNSIELALAFQGLSENSAKTIWRSFLTWLEHNPDKFEAKTRFAVIPGRKMWDYKFIQQKYSSAIETDKRSGQPVGQFWWAGGDAEQVSIFWYTYQSRWIPLGLFGRHKAKTLAEALFLASRHWTIGFHFNKGQAGASSEAIRLGRETSINPELYNAAALAIAGAGNGGFPGVKGREPNIAIGEDQKAKVTAAMKFLHEITEGAGSYSNEADYFEPNWQTDFWGRNYPRLLEIKKKYDPSSMFICHHCVGSED